MFSGTVDRWAKDQVIQLWPCSGIWRDFDLSKITGQDERPRGFDHNTTYGLGNLVLLSCTVGVRLSKGGWMSCWGRSGLSVFFYLILEFTQTHTITFCSFSFEIYIFLFFWILIVL